MLKGIDVSVHQGNINWEHVKPQIDFAIIRCGYGDDIVSQDDKQFERNVGECVRLGIPYGVYLYSYADSYEHINSEVSHVLRLLKGKTPFCVYIDMEDAKTIKCGKSTLTDFAKVFCEGVKTHGYNVGVYANQNWCKNHLDIAYIKNIGCSVWCAKYASTKPDIAAEFDIWQYSSSGHIDGIQGNVDMNYMYNDIRCKQEKSVLEEKIDVVYQTWDDIKNRWLPNVKNDNDYAGNYGNDVCCVFVNLSKGNIWYKVHTKGGKWLPEVINRNDFAGIYNRPIDALMMKTDTGKGIKYRVHLRKDGRWLPWVSGYDEKDSNNGFAGIIGQEIDAIQITF